MEINETTEVLATINALYPNFKVDDMAITLKAWNLALKDFSKADVDMAVNIYVTTKGSPFPPSVSELIAMIRKPSELIGMSEGEAWSLVSKAIRNSAYNSETEFAKLSPEIQKAIGSASQLRIWALDEEYNESVVSSNFMRSYRIVNERQREISYLPKEVRAKLDAIINERKGIEAK